MNRIVLLFLLCLIGISSYAQMPDVNIDIKTAEAMGAAFGQETLAEIGYTNQVKDIFKQYVGAEAATATIFGSKYLERRALTNAGVWGSESENLYYRRICELVSKRITPKILDVAKLMISNPENAMYWGSYLIKICAETKALCMQFESLVTNHKLSFSSVVFLDLNPEIKKLFESAQQNLVNWDNMQRLLTSAPEKFSKEMLMADLENLGQLAKDIADSSLQNVLNHVMQGTNFNDLMQGKISGLYDAVISCEKVYGNVNSLLSGELKNILGDNPTIDKLFTLAEYDISGWIDKFETTAPSTERHYTQKWYIKSIATGTQVLCDYHPPRDNTSLNSTRIWTYISRIYSDTYMPGGSMLLEIKEKSERNAGWSEAMVNQLQAENPNKKYEITHTLERAKSPRGYLVMACSIKVTCEGSAQEETVHEELFDSYSMNLTSFRKKLDLLLEEYNDNPNGVQYVLAYGPKNYYTISSADKLSGMESVTISMTCEDSTAMLKGKTTYKCRKCKGTIDNHTRECAMLTSLSNENLDTSELDDLEADYNRRCTEIQERVKELNAENTTLKNQMAFATADQAIILREKYNANLVEIANLKQEYNDCQQKLQELQAAREEISADNADTSQTDDHYRIPAILQDCSASYSIRWSPSGEWNGDTYTRKGKATKQDYDVTFKATLSVQKPPKYFLGILIRKAQINIEYELFSEHAKTQLMDVIKFSPNMSASDREKLVNDRISQIAQQYPNCKIDTEYVSSTPALPDETLMEGHMLWSSDRLAIAREVDSRLHIIYADLVSMEKMMNYKRSIIDILLSVAPPINDTQGKRQDVIRQARSRWLEAAKGVTNRREDNTIIEGEKRK